MCILTVRYDLSDDKYVTAFLTIKPTRCINFSNLFCNETLHVSDSSSVHHQEFFTVHTAMVCYTGLLTACEQEHSLLLTNCQQTCMTFTIAVWSSISCPLASSQRTCTTYTWMLYVQSWTPDDGRKDRPKHVEWYSINSKNCASSWFYYRNMSRCTVTWKSNSNPCWLAIAYYFRP